MTRGIEQGLPVGLSGLDGPLTKPTRTGPCHPWSISCCLHRDPSINRYGDERIITEPRIAPYGYRVRAEHFAHGPVLGFFLRFACLHQGHLQNGPIQEGSGRMFQPLRYPAEIEGQPSKS